MCFKPVFISSMEDILKNVLVCFCPYTESQWGPVLNNLSLWYSLAMQMQLSLRLLHRRSRRLFYTHKLLLLSEKELELEHDVLWYADVMRLCMCVMWIAVLHKLWYITVQRTAGLRRTHTHTIPRIHNLRNHTLSKSLHNRLTHTVPGLGTCVCVCF